LDLPPDAIADTLQHLPAALKTRASLDAHHNTVTWQGRMSREQHHHLRMVFSRSKTAIAAIDRLYLRANHLPDTPLAHAESKPPFIVPLLGWKAPCSQGELMLDNFRQQHFLNTIWRLDECDASGILHHFQPSDKGQRGKIDIAAQQQIHISFEKHITESEYSKIHEPAWTAAKLIRFLDPVAHPDYSKSSAIIFIQKTLDILQNTGYSLAELVRYRFDLLHAVRDTVDALRNERAKTAWNALLAEDAGYFSVSSNLALVLDAQRYAFNQPYSGGTRFNKHYFDIIGDLKADGEEFDCAVYLDRLPAVQYWVRNVENKPFSFSAAVFTLILSRCCTTSAFWWWSTRARICMRRNKTSVPLAQCGPLPVAAPAFFACPPRANGA